MLYSILFMYRCTSLDTASKKKINLKEYKQNNYIYLDFFGFYEITGAVSNYYIACLYLNAELVSKC